MSIYFHVIIIYEVLQKHKTSGADLRPPFITVLSLFSR